MHYRNGRKAKNGDKIVSLHDGKIKAFGVLHSAESESGSYCNGMIAPIQHPFESACLCDCLHMDDIEAILTEKGLDKRPAGM